ncbi:ribonuclease H-like domain-containing protein, partial [Tanacetum coccineum]
DSSSSSESSNGVNIVDFLVNNSGNDTVSNDDIVATQNEKVSTLEENVFSKASKFPYWIDVMNQEMDALLRNGTWEIIELPKDRKAIGSKSIFKIKYQSSGEIDRFNGRLVTHGFGQKEDGIVYMRPPDEYFCSDDIIITCNNVSKIEKFKVFLKSKFMIKDLGKLKYFLGIEVVDIDKGICLNQRKCVLDLLSEYVIQECFVKIKLKGA